MSTLSSPGEPFPAQNETPNPNLASSDVTRTIREERFASQLHQRLIWGWLRVLMFFPAAYLLWYGFNSALHAHTIADDIAAGRALQAQHLAGLLPGAKEQNFFGSSGHFEVADDSSKASISDQIAADGAMVTYFSTSASDSWTVMWIAVSAALTSTVIAVSGVRGVLAARLDRLYPLV